jgi:hypothetical protein
MKAFKTTKRIFLLLILLNLAAGSLVAGAFILIRRENQQAASFLSEVEEATKIEGNLKSIKAIMLDTEKKRASLDSYFIHDKDLITFLDEMNTLGKSAGVELSVQSVDIDVSSEKALFTEALKLSLQTKAAWPDTYHFLSLLETLPFKVSFEQVSINHESDESVTPAGAKAKPKNILWDGTFTLRILKMRDVPLSPKES